VSFGVHYKLSINLTDYVYFAFFFVLLFRDEVSWVSHPLIQVKGKIFHEIERIEGNHKGSKRD